MSMASTKLPFCHTWVTRCYSCQQRLNARVYDYAEKRTSKGRIVVVITKHIPLSREFPGPK